MAVRQKWESTPTCCANTPLGVVENAPTQVLKNAQSYILWDLLGNNRLIAYVGERIGERQRLSRW